MTTTYLKHNIHVLNVKTSENMVHTTYIGVQASTSLRYSVAGGHPRRKVHSLSDVVTKIK